MKELPLAHPIFGCPGIAWPRVSMYRSNFQDPKLVLNQQKEINIVV